MKLVSNKVIKKTQKNKLSYSINKNLQLHTFVFQGLQKVSPVAKTKDYSSYIRNPCKTDAVN
jgi:hypothetical protein